jgi:hypothetical protein
MAKKGGFPGMGRPNMGNRGRGFCHIFLLSMCCMIKLKCDKTPVPLTHVPLTHSKPPSL